MSCEGPSARGAPSARPSPGVALHKHMAVWCQLRRRAGGHMWGWEGRASAARALVGVLRACLCATEPLPTSGTPRGVDSVDAASCYLHKQAAS